MRLPDLADIEAEKCRRSFYFFVRQAWAEVEPHTRFVDGWHIRAICEYLQALDEGRIPSNNLLINVPPRHMKSLLCNVFLPAWVWTRNPWTKFLFYSYSEDLTIRDNMKCRALIGSRWYQERFHVRISERNDTKSQFENLDGGYRYCFGMRGSIAGQGGDYLVIDDPLEIGWANSKDIRDDINERYDNAISTRGNDPKTVKKVLIMQRLHEEDLAGHILEGKDTWEQLILPAEYEGERFHSSIGFRDPRTGAGELLWPERFGPDEIAEMKNTLSAMMVAGQLQQRPSPLSGAIFKREWFQDRRSSMRLAKRFFSWDTAASMEDGSAYTCGIVGELTTDWRLFIREVVRERLEFPQLQYAIEGLEKKYDVRKVVEGKVIEHEYVGGILIENKSSGISVIQSIRQTSPKMADLIVPFNPSTSIKDRKVVAAYEAAKWCEKGMVVLPPPSDEFPWLAAFEEELFSFPNTKYKDQVDALSQLTAYLSYYLQKGLEARRK